MGSIVDEVAGAEVVEQNMGMKEEDKENKN